MSQTLRKRPSVKLETYEALMKWASPGQTPDGAIRELLMEQGVEVKVE